MYFFGNSFNKKEPDGLKHAIYIPAKTYRESLDLNNHLSVSQF